MNFHAIFLSLCLLLACEKPVEQSMTNTISKIAALNYLALGDSYTIGESVAQHGSFPYQLASQLNSAGLKVVAPKIVAKTGWTTGELMAAIKTENSLKRTYDMVTLLIGVNNQYRGYSQTAYRTEFKMLLQTALNFAGGNKKHVFVVSIPDWGVTPFGKGSGRDQNTIAKEIDGFNAINKEEALAIGVSYTDITAKSRLASTELTLIANDGLHPSEKMYAEWASLLAPKIKGSFD